ncbi:MAG: NADAR family protein, partial [Caldilineaceae bacterium]|nr:NADAR family protein [Caldilineaceae bacterium]
RLHVGRADARVDALIAWVDDTGLRSDWDAVRDEAMLVALRARFTQHPALRAQLLATGDAVLIEHTLTDIV